MHTCPPSTQSIYAKARVEECLKVLADPTLLVPRCFFLVRLCKQLMTRHWTQLCMTYPQNNRGHTVNTPWAPWQPQHYNTMCSKTDNFAGAAVEASATQTAGTNKFTLQSNSSEDRSAVRHAGLLDHIWKTKWKWQSHLCLHCNILIYISCITASRLLV